MHWSFQNAPGIVRNFFVESRSGERGGGGGGGGRNTERKSMKIHFQLHAPQLQGFDKALLNKIHSKLS